MGVINYSASKQVLVVARGHPYPRDALAQVFDGLSDYCWSLVEQPAAGRFFSAESVGDYSAIVCYDMPGIDFTVEKDAPRLIDPHEKFKADMLAMLSEGMGMVFLHHSLAAWPAWDDYADIVGGRFLYRPAYLNGQAWPDSGYRHDVRHTISIELDHPVTYGMPDSFSMVDELYLCPIFTSDIVPILVSDFSYLSENFYSAKLAVDGRMFQNEGWSHPMGSNIVGWIKHFRNSPIVYLQGGDSESALLDQNFGQLVRNAVRWVSSSEAHDWARKAFDSEQYANF